MNKNATSTAKPTVKVIGVGCGGNNIVNHISTSHLEGFSFVACDMDAKVLEKSAAATTLQIGTDGLGSGNNPEKANIAAEENTDAIKKLFDDRTSIRRQNFNDLCRHLSWRRMWHGRGSRNRP